MQSKLQEITNKIYQEGVEKGTSEANQIVEEAKKQAEKIIADAKKESDSILNDAKKQADETLSNTQNEIKLSAKQALNGLKQQVTDLINSNIIDQSTKESFSDKAFIQKIVETTLKNWSSGGAQSMNIDVLLPENDKEAIAKHLAGSAKEVLDKGLEIKSASDVSTGFQIEAKDGSYKVSFTDADFANFFKQYLRPKLIDLLF